MAAAWLIGRRELRPRAGSLLALAVLVALVAGAVLGALVGAWRTATSVDRFREDTGASDVAYQSSDPREADGLVRALRADGDVEGVANRVLVNAFLVDGAISDIAIHSDPEGVYGVDVDRPRLIAGRLPDPAAPDEVLLNEQAAELTGLGVGDRIRARTWSADDLTALFAETDFPGFNGPELDLEVVGVGRTAEGLSNDLRRTSPAALAGPDFVAAHPGMGVWPPAVVVRVAPGADLERISAVVARAATDAAPAGGVDADALAPTITTSEDLYLTTARNTVRGLTAGLVVFACIALVAGGLTVGQAIARHVVSTGDVRGLTPLGLTTGQVAAAQSLPVALAAGAGVVVGAVLAAASSLLLPLGLARRAEVDPGLVVRPVPLVIGAVALWAGIVAFTYLVGRRAARRRSRAPAPARAATLSSAVRRAGTPESVCVGVDLATRRGPGMLPVRSALVGVAVCIAGVVGAGIVTASVQELRSDPAHWGWTWSTMPDYFGDGDIAALERGLRQDDRVDAVGNLVVDTVVLDEQPTTAYAIQVLTGSMGLTLLDGRLPSSPDEVALGRGTLRRLGVDVGDRLSVGGPDDAAAEVTVVGVAVLPATDESRSDIGAAFTPGGLRRHGSGDSLSSVVLRYPGGARGRAVERALASDYGFDFGVFTRPQVPGSIRNLDEARNVALAVAALLSMLAAVGLFHALIVSGRRRRGDLAMLQVLGLRRRQVRRVVLVQAVVLVALGVVVGVPVGMMLGRAVWWMLVDGLGVIAEARAPWALVVLLVPGAALLAAAAAWWPARRALRHAPATRLRVE